MVWEKRVGIQNFIVNKFNKTPDASFPPYYSHSRSFCFSFFQFLTKSVSDVSKSNRNDVSLWFQNIQTAGYRDLKLKRFQMMTNEMRMKRKEEKKTFFINITSLCLAMLDKKNKK